MQRERGTGPHRVRFEQPGRDRCDDRTTDLGRDVEVVRDLGDCPQVHPVAYDGLAAVQLPSHPVPAQGLALFVAHVVNVADGETLDRFETADAALHAARFDLQREIVRSREPRLVVTPRCESGLRGRSAGRRAATPGEYENEHEREPGPLRESHGDAWVWPCWGL